MTNNKIYLNNLNKEVTEALLNAHFSLCGEISEIILPIDKKSKSPKGYAFISFAEPSATKSALDQDGKLFLEKIITVQLATEKRPKK
ncbi:MAG: RNA-binding protein [Gammaproteobacteria bacterium]|nr:RNA-binding protein [Gammaproteobacteria bacterium]